MRRVFRDDHELFRDQVRRFIAQEIAPHYAAWETAGVTPASLWRRAGEEGLLNCALPEPYGLGGDFGHAAVVIEELARANYLGIGFSIHSDMVAPYVDAFGTEAQKARWLPAMTRGELIGALALTEPGAGSDLKAIRSRAVRDGDHYVLNGQKTFITNGVNAGLAIVLASTAPDLGARPVAILRRGRTARLRQGRAAGQDRPAQPGHLRAVLRRPAPARRLPAGTRKRGLRIPDARTGARAPGARAAASLEGMLEETAEYIRGRKVFGRRVIDYQNSRFILANARAQSVMLRVFLDDCLAQLMAGELDATTAAIAKLNATEIQGKALDELLQLYGGYGYMAEYGIGRAWSDARALRLFGGTSEIMREIIGRGFA